MSETNFNPGIFPVGKLFPEESLQYFTGKAYSSTLSKENAAISNTTLEPGCVNNWHIHHKAGQTLLVTGGTGWYQVWGEAPRELHAGDVVDIPPEVKHWHGAKKDSWFSYVVVKPLVDGSTNEWLEPVSDPAFVK